MRINGYKTADKIIGECNFGFKMYDDKERELYHLINMHIAHAIMDEEFCDRNERYHHLIGVLQCMNTLGVCGIFDVANCADRVHKFVYR